MRFAIYFAPEPDSALARLGAAWLGRDAFSGEIKAPPARGGLSEEEWLKVTTDPRRYGFHATLKAPFRLGEGETQAGLQAALAGFARSTCAVPPQKLALRQIDGFFALVPEHETPALGRLADEVVAAFDRFRAPITEADIARRDPDALSLRQLRYLRRWGYPFVQEEYRFHMTLTGRVREPGDAHRMHAILDELFAATIAEPVAVDRLALFEEPGPGAPFTVRAHHRLEGQAASA